MKLTSPLFILLMSYASACRYLLIAQSKSSSTAFAKVLCNEMLQQEPSKDDDFVINCFHEPLSYQNNMVNDFFKNHQNYPKEKNIYYKQLQEQFNHLTTVYEDQAFCKQMAYMPEIEDSSFSYNTEIKKLIKKSDKPIVFLITDPYTTFLSHANLDLKDANINSVNDIKQPLTKMKNSRDYAIKEFKINIDLANYAIKQGKQAIIIETSDLIENPYKNVNEVLNNWKYRPAVVKDKGLPFANIISKNDATMDKQGYILTGYDTWSTVKGEKWEADSEESSIAKKEERLLKKFPKDFQPEFEKVLKNWQNFVDEQVKDKKENFSKGNDICLA